MRGLAPQPRLIWAVAIGAGLIALAVASPVLGFVAFVYNAGLAIIPARDLALLPGRSGYEVRRAALATFSLGGAGGVYDVIPTPWPAGRTSSAPDRAPPGAPAEARAGDGPRV